MEEALIFARRVKNVKPKKEGIEMSLIVGLTGGIASGKSTVSKMFKDEGIPVIETDSISHELLKNNKAIFKAIVETFGEDVLTPSKAINRNVLGKMIFKDPKKREALNKIVHPKVKERVHQEIDHFKKLEESIIVVDVPLLFEVSFDKMMDKTIVVYAKKSDQLERLMSREGIDEAYAKQKIKSQMSLSKKKELADYCIDNTKSILETRKSFVRILNKLKASV